MAKSWREQDASDILDDDEDYGEASSDAIEPPRTVSPREAYLAALGSQGVERVRTIAEALAVEVRRNAPAAEIARRVAEHLDEHAFVSRIIAALPPECLAALGLVAVTERTDWPLVGLSHALISLGVDPTGALSVLSDLGLLAVGRNPAAPDSDWRTMAAQGTITWLDDAPAQAFEVCIHPAVVVAARPWLPDGSTLPRVQEVRLIREADGLEPILRLAVVWQRVNEDPLRQTQQGAFYKRDRERLEDDAAIAGPITDALEPLPDMPGLWLTLARDIGLLVVDPAQLRVSAAPPTFWEENAYHLAQMIGSRWLSLRSWHEQGGLQREGAEARLALPYVRATVLLWLATLGEGDWIATEDLATWLRSFDPRWDRPAFSGPPVLPGDRAKPPRTGRARPKSRETDEDSANSSALESMLLGLGYQLGLIRAAEEVPSGRRVVQLTTLGRYLLTLGPPPAPRPAFEHFLFVQPSFEVIAYRQGLTPPLIGRFSRFTKWTQVGAALAFMLTPESVYRGLEGGLGPAAMLETLQRHSARPLPPGVAEALRTWAIRRERVTYHGAATLMEFLSPADLERALALWPADPERPGPVRVTDRLLLVEDERNIPFQRFRLTGSRSYRNPPEACVVVGEDGVSLMLDPSRSDLLVDAELTRFADEIEAIDGVPRAGAPGSVALPRRRFVVSASSLERAANTGMNATLLHQWFTRRTGEPIPPAIRLLQHASTGKSTGLSASRPLVLRVPSPEILDGLAQHPDTRDYLGERLGPSAAVISPTILPAFRSALSKLGLELEIEAD